MSLIVQANERGRVRVFALSLTPQEARALANDPAEQAKTLGLQTLDSTYVEIFPVADLDELGLVGYLIEGNGIDPDSLGKDRARLKALSGWVMVVYSRAFSEAALTLKTVPALTHIGTYTQPGVDWSSEQTLTSQAATTPSTPVKKPVSDAAMSGRIATLALLVLFALTAVMVWISG